MPRFPHDSPHAVALTTCAVTCGSLAYGSRLLSRVQRAALKDRVLRNYELKADAGELDNKIRLLVQKRATVADVMQSRGAKGGGRKIRLM